MEVPEATLQQGAHSRLFFFIAKESLSRGLINLAKTQMVERMVHCRKYMSQNHLMFTDDIIIYSKENKKSIKHLVGFLGKHQAATGQCVNKDKCKVFLGSIQEPRKSVMLELLGTNEGVLPGKYLGVPLLQGHLTRLSWLH